MSKRLMREGLHHKWMSKDGEFFALIDATGGWPVGYEYVGFCHTDGREAGFCNSSYNDGWWTVLHHADDYYLWKMSPEGVQRIADAVRSSIRVPQVDVTKISIKTWRGYMTPAVKPAQNKPGQESVTGEQGQS